MKIKTYFLSCNGLVPKDSTFGYSISFFHFPSDVRVPSLSNEEVFQLLSTPVRSGSKVSLAAFVASVVGVIVAVIGGTAPAQLFGVGIALLFGIWHVTAKRKLQLARRIANEPTFVTWAHPTILELETGFKLTYFTLHLATGKKFELALGRENMVAIFDWLQRRNPGVRLSGSL